MITFLSKCISHFLCKNNVITEEDFSIYQYGFEIIFSTILGFLITIGIGFLLRMEILSILYYIIFVTLRQLTGGYHADSYFKCNLIFTAVSFVTMGMTQLSVDSKQYTFIFYLILIGTSLAVTAASLLHAAILLRKAFLILFILISSFHKIWYYN